MFIFLEEKYNILKYNRLSIHMLNFLKWAFKSRSFAENRVYNKKRLYDR